MTVKMQSIRPLGSPVWENSLMFNKTQNEWGGAKVSHMLQALENRNDNTTSK